MTGAEHIDVDATRRRAFWDGAQFGLATAVVLALLIAAPLVALAR